MEFNLKESIEILKCTPILLDSFLGNLSNCWIHENEGDNTWSPFDIIGHLIHGEKTDWITRVKIILAQDGDCRFTPFDRFAQFHDSKDKTLLQLLQQFKSLRERNIETLKRLSITEEQLLLKGKHPEFGTVTLEHLLSTWVVHDLGHIAQIARVMSYQYKTKIGPWKDYLPIVNN